MSNILTVDLAIRNSGFVVWKEDIPIHWEALKTEKTSKKLLKETRQQLKILKKITDPTNVTPGFKRILDRPVKDFFILDNKVCIYYRNVDDEKTGYGDITLPELIKVYEDRLLCKAVALDRVRRSDLLCDKIIELIKEYDITHIIAELPSGSQSAEAANMLGMATSTFSSTVRTLKIKRSFVTPHQVKMILCNKRTAQKEEIMARVRELYPDCAFPKYIYKFEHIADAVGVKLAYDKILLDIVT